MESSHDKDEYFTISDCDLCGEDNRYVEHGKDTFGVHVIDYCAYGCNNEKVMLIFENLNGYVQIDRNLKRGLSERHSSRAKKKKRGKKKYKVFWTDVS
jgi:hypothetical protein